MQKITSKETVRTCRAIIGILPHAKITNLNQDANSARSAYSGTLEVDSQRSKKSKKRGGKDQLLC